MTLFLKKLNHSDFNAEAFILLAAESFEDNNEAVKDMLSSATLTPVPSLH